jgi:uncharacterized RDD family membrane protein YckC
MKKITIITPANIELEYRLAGVGSRLAAFIIDYVIQLLAVALVGGIILLGFDYWLMGNPYPGGAAVGAVLLAYFLIHFGYFILFEMYMNGQSPGKKIFGLRAIRENGLPITFFNVVVRALFRASVDMLYIGLFSIMFSKQHKRLGDMAAGTVVVCENYDVDISGLPRGTAFAKNDNFPFNVPSMTPEESRIVDEWLRRKASLPDGGEKVRRQLEEYFEKKTFERIV